jgi:hypothetical protein
LEAVLRDFPKVRIVISSTWREIFNLDELRTYFSADIATRIIGVTPVNGVANGSYTPFRREGEILEWLEAAGFEPSSDWIALDDAAWQFNLYRKSLILCKSYIGFDDAAAESLRRALSARNPMPK